jgi:hypothetical protein
VTFQCVSGLNKDRTTWQIVCSDGSWNGRPLNCGKHLPTIFVSSSSIVKNCRVANVSYVCRVFILKFGSPIRKRRWSLCRRTWPAVKQILHLSQQRSKLDDFLRRPTNHRRRGRIPAGYRTSTYSIQYILELWVLLLHRRCIRYMSLHFSLLCWTLSWSSFFFKTWPAVYLLPSWLQMCPSFLTALLRFLGATILASSLSPDRFDADAVVAIGRAWNQLVSVSVKKTITPVRDRLAVKKRTINYRLMTLFLELFFKKKTVEKPPTILFRHQLGPIAQSNDGRLIVYPGTIVHMECLWIRRFGTPKWEVSHQYRYFSFYFKLECGSF